MLHNASPIKSQKIRNSLGILACRVLAIMQVSNIFGEPIVHNCEIDCGPNNCQSADGILSAWESEWIVLNVVYVDISQERSTDIFLDVKYVNELVPDGSLLFFAGGLWWAVRFSLSLSRDEREEEKSEVELDM